MTARPPSTVSSSTAPGGPLRGSKPDPRKDKFAYFKDNIVTEDDEFDPKMYYYQRQDNGKDVPHNGVLLHPPQTVPPGFWL